MQIYLTNSPLDQFRHDQLKRGKLGSSCCYFITFSLSLTLAIKGRVLLISDKPLLRTISAATADWNTYWSCTKILVSVERLARANKAVYFVSLSPTKNKAYQT